MKKKHYINFDTVKLISSTTVIVFVIAICFIFTGKIQKQLRNDTKNSYLHLVNTDLNAYEQLLKTKLESYQKILDYIYDKEFFSTASTEEITSYLYKTKAKLGDEVYDFFYIDTDYVVHCTNGNNESLKFSSKLLDNYSTDKNKYYISNGFHSKKSGKDLIFMGRPIYDKNEKPKGSIGVGFDISVVKDIVKQLDSVSNNSLTIQDENGIFLYHPDSNMIMKTYTPSSKEYEGVTSQYISSINSGEVNTVDLNGVPIRLFFRKVDGTKWTITFKIPQSKIDEIQTEPVIYKFYIIVLALFVIIIAVTIENVLIKTFQRREMMLATYDPLTNLWARQKFETEAKKIIKKHPFTKFMLIEADIRGFKFINQNFGEDEADKLIKYVARLLTKETSHYHCVIGRGFSDHFFVLIRITSVRNAMNEFKAFINRTNEEIKQYDIPFKLKFGITFLLQNKKNKDISIQNLIGQATFAKTTIKDDMVNDYAIYNSRLLKKVNEEKFLENNMEKALQNKEFFVMYQPKISLETNKIVGAEALVRWKNPEMGLLMPNSFIELFEKNGFIKKLDFYVYNEVFKFISKLQKEKLPVVPISINMSRSHSKPEKFVHDFVQAFKKYGLTTDLIEVEILERSVMDNNTLKLITELLHKEGFSVAMDDFGSGESSLNMLTTIPVDILKFDRAFLISASTDDGTIDPDSSNIIATLINLGHSLKKKTIFEGVETESQRDFLKSANCDQVQGYFYSKPLSEEDFIEYLKNHS